MQTLYEAASHIALEIERTKQHLHVLEQALEGLRPLVNRAAPAQALPYAKQAGAAAVQDVAVLEPRTARALPVRSKSGRRKLPEKASALPKTGAQVWEAALGRKKSSLDDVVNQAIVDLQLTPASRSVLRNRAGAWLFAAARKDAVKISVGKSGKKLYQLAKPA